MTGPSIHHHVRPVREALAALAPGSFVLLEEPTHATSRKPWRRLGRRAPGRFVQARRDEEGTDLLLEAIGPCSLGGPYPMDDATLSALRSLGWRAPGDADWEPIGGPLLRRFVPWSEVDDAAVLLLETLAVLGVDLDTIRTTLG